MTFQNLQTLGAALESASRTETAPRAHDHPCRPFARLQSLQVLLLLIFTALECRGGSLTETIDAVAPKVVKIFGAGGRKNLAAYGSGFLVTPQGHIVTVWSHVLDGEAVTVVLHDGRRFLGRIVGAEPSLDLAVLKIDGEDLPCFDLSSDVAESGPGSTVLAFSNMFKVATGDEAVSVIHGVISARTSLSASRGGFAAPYTGPVYVVDAVTNNSGAAGGVLTTQDGRLLGMLGKELRNNVTHTWLNYVVPIRELAVPIDEIVTGRFRPRAEKDEFASVTVRRFTPRDFGILLVPDVVARTPAYIDRVLPDSAAAAAGLQPEDLVVFVGDRVVSSARVFLDEVGQLEPGDRLTLVVRRGDKLETLTLSTPRENR